VQTTCSWKMYKIKIYAKTNFARKIVLFFFIDKWKISNLVLAPPPETASRATVLLPLLLGPLRRLWRRRCAGRRCRCRGAHGGHCDFFLCSLSFCFIVDMAFTEPNSILAVTWTRRGWAAGLSPAPPPPPADDGP